MDDNVKHHEQLVRGISAQLKVLLDSSQQAIYIYLDDSHKTCNQKFASMLGYQSPDEWARVAAPFETFVDPHSQETLASNYHQAMEKMTGASFAVTWKKRSGGTVNTNVILVPVVYDDHLFALHFIQ